MAETAHVNSCDSQLETSLDWDQVDEVSQAQLHTAERIFWTDVSNVSTICPFRIQNFNNFNIVIMHISTVTWCLGSAHFAFRHTKIRQEAPSERESSLGRMLRVQSDPQCGIWRSLVCFVSGRLLPCWKCHRNFRGRWRQQLQVLLPPLCLLSHLVTVEGIGCGDIGR